MQKSELIIFDNLKADIQLFVEPVTGMTVRDSVSSDKALEAGKQVKSYVKKIEETRKALVGPLNDEVKRINDYAKQIAEPLLKAESHLKTELIAHERTLEIQRAEEAKRVEAARIEAEKEAKAKFEAQKEEAATMAMFMDEKDVKRSEIVAEAEMSRELVTIHQNHAKEAKAVAQTKVSGITRRWTFEVTDKSQLPSEFLIADEVAIGKLVRSGVREIAGVRIYQEAGIAI